MNIIIRYNSKNIKIKNVKKLSEFGKGIGLMFRRREKSPTMLFEFKEPNKMLIHSLFVFFKFGAIWLDDKNKIIDKKIVRPFKFSISSKKHFYKLVEIPLNNNYKKEIRIIFGK
jgi:uncharacterized membrane protein (UPF0127 family)